jgi:hypothetical protein
MPEFYLGSNLVSALYLGTQEICTSYLGGTQSYDGCGFIPVVVTLSVTNNIAGPSAGYTIGGDNTGSQRSGEPLVGTYSFNTTVSLNSGYEWVSGPSISNASGTFPASNQTVFTILSGEVRLTPTNKTVTLSVVDNVNDPGVSHTLSGDLNGATVTGLPGTPYSFTTNLNVNSEWSGTITPSTTQTISGTIPSNNDTVTITFNGTLTQNQYVVNHAYDTSGVTGTQYSSPVSSVTSPSSEVISSTGSQVTGYAGATWNFVTSGLIANSNYEWTSGPTLSPTSPRAVSISGGQSTPSTITTFVSGTVSQIPPPPTLYYVAISSSPGSCGDDRTSAYWWADPLGYLSGSSEANTIAPSGTQVYADANYSDYYSTAGIYSVAQPGTGDDYTQYISNIGIVGPDSAC